MPTSNSRGKSFGVEGSKANSQPNLHELNPSARVRLDIQPSLMIDEKMETDETTMKHHNMTATLEHLEKK